MRLADHRASGALVVRQISANTGRQVATSNLPAGCSYNIANQGSVALMFGNDHRDGVPRGEGTDLYLQEVRLYPSTLDAATIKLVYDNLRSKWNVP